MKLLNKILSFISVFLLIFYQITVPLTVLAQEATTTGDNTVVATPSASVEPSPTPTPTLSLDESLTIPLASESAVIVDTTATENVPGAAVSPEIWKTNEDGSATTINNVVLNEVYKAPQNDKVTVTFTKLPENPGTLTIKQIILSQEDKEDLGAVTDTAYDITSNMENGTFEYILTLPTPETENVEVKASEDGETFVTLGGVTAQTDTLTITGLNHFTVFVVSNPTAQSNGIDGETGTLDWNLTNSVFSSDDLYATVNLNNNNISHYLKATSYGFSIPSTATILGITVEIEKKCSSATGCIDSSVRLIKGGVVSGNDKADIVTDYPTSDNIYKSYGGSSDLWGLTLTPADINAIDFGVAFASERTAGGSQTFSVDHIKVTVYYNTPPNTPALSAPADGAATQDTTPDLSWTAATPVDVDNGDTITYTLQVDNNADFSTPEFNQSAIATTTQTTSALLDGTYNWRVRAVDNSGLAGNWTASRTLIIDTQAPTITYNYPTAGGQTGWYNANPGTVIDIDFIWGGGSPLDHASKDYGSGFTTIFSLDQSSDYTTNWGLTNLAWNSLSEGASPINIKVADVAGNIRIDNYSAGVLGFLFRKDTVAPATTDNSDGAWHNSAVTVNLSCSDATSLCANTYYTTDDNDPATSGTAGTTINLSADGMYDLKYYSKDNANNSESVHTIINAVKIDTIAPTTPVPSVAAGDYTTDQSVTLTSSDLNGYTTYYTTDSTTPSNTSTLYNGAINVNKDMTIKAIAYDPAGNASTILSATYGIAPVISAEATSSVADTSLTVTWTTDDPATSRVVYGTLPVSDATVAIFSNGSDYGYPNSTIEDTTKVNSHLVTVTGLSANTTYFYRTVSHGSPETVGSEKSTTTAAVAAVSTSTSGGGGRGGDGGDGLGCAVNDCSGNLTRQNPVLNTSTPKSLVVSKPAGFAPGVLGISTETGNVGIGKEEQVQGESTESTQISPTTQPQEKGQSPFNAKVVLVIIIALLLGFGIFKLIIK